MADTSAAIESASSSLSELAPEARKTLDSARLAFLAITLLSAAALLMATVALLSAKE